MASKKFIPSLLLILTNLTATWGGASQTATATSSTDPNGFANIMTISFLIMAGLLIVFAIAVMVRTNAFLSKNLIQLQSKTKTS